MYGSSSAYPGYPSPAPPSTSLYSPPPPQDYYQQQQHNPYSQPSTSYHHQPYAQPPYVRAESPQIIPLAHQVNQDPNPIAFLTFYRRILDELTCNSKYIITNATIIASELLNRANDIARCLDDHIMQCHPEHRLYAMYALDSICKNVGAPYVTLLSETISRIFLETYRLVDQRNKMLMEQLLATWRDSGPNGSPLFGTDAQWNIERQIFGAPQPIGPRSQPQQVQQNLTPQHYPPPPPVPASSTDDEQQRAVMEIDRLLEIGSIEQSRNPENIKNRTRLDALSQLKAIVRSTAVSPIELNQINQQLAALSNEFRALQIQQQEQEQRQRFASPVPGGNGTPTHISSALAALSGLSRSSSSNVDTPPLRGTPLPEVMATNGNSAAANDLIKSLMQAGLLPGGSTPQSTSTSTDPQPELEVEDEDAAYTAALSSLSTSLTAISLSKTNPPRDLVLTSNSFLPLQCKQCANRYPDSKVGKKNLQTHLDWHFRQNRRSKESKARGMYRGWNAKIEDWIRGGHDDSPLQAGSSTEETSLSAISSAQQSHLKAQFDSSFVITPSDPEIASEPCPICKEPFKSEFSEDEEEWIWKGTIKENGVYYHASCHHSAKSLKESVAKDNNKRANSPSISSSGGGGRNSRNNTPKPDSPSSVTTSLPVNTSSESGLVSRLKQEEGVQNLSLSLNGNNRKRKAEDDEEVADQSTKAAQDSSSSPHQNGDDNATNRDGEMEQDHQKDEDSAPPAKKVAT